MNRLLLIAVSVGVLSGARLLAHHSFAAEFDDKQPIKLTGVLKKVDWTNPHIWYYVEVKNPDGTTTMWALSGGAPGQLMRRGIRKDQLVVGRGTRRVRRVSFGARYVHRRQRRVRRLAATKLHRLVSSRP